MPIEQGPAAAGRQDERAGFAAQLLLLCIAATLFYVEAVPRRGGGRGGMGIFYSIWRFGWPRDCRTAEHVQLAEGQHHQRMEIRPGGAGHRLCDRDIGSCFTVVSLRRGAHQQATRATHVALDVRRDLLPRRGGRDLVYQPGIWRAGLAVRLDGAVRHLASDHASRGARRACVVAEVLYLAAILFGQRKLLVDR